MLAEVEVADKREIMANQLLVKGCASVKELLTVSFGEWPPKGLEINPEIKHSQTVKLIPMKGDAAMALATPPVLQQELWIKLNKELIQQYGMLYSTMGHEMTHILQGEHSTRLQKSFSMKMAEFFKGGQGVVSEDIMTDFTSRKGNALTLKSDFNKNSGRKLSHSDELMFRMSKVINSKGSEIQARIHQIVIDGYPRWGKVPATSDEFYAAMKNAGFQLPDHIEKKLAELPENSSARHFLSCEEASSKVCKNKVADIQSIIDSLQEKSRPGFWNEVMPALYTDLIEMYGDGPGRARFGLGVNPKTQMPLKYFPGQADVKKTSPAPS
ncbi:MAG: hypothetical protein K8R48_07060 [Alphaproteobacteria bacterium]|nr:hypothetical protein [Alphaproteobacteria bacterium]